LFKGLWKKILFPKNAEDTMREQKYLKKPIIPVYLNQRIVFDLLAMLEGGICHVTRVASAEQKAEQNERRYGAEFGLSKALASLLSIAVSGEGKQAGSTTASLRKSEERIHTPASLFYRLRNQLQIDGGLQVLRELEPPKEYDLVEFSAAMVRNPVGGHRVPVVQKRIKPTAFWGIFRSLNF